MKKTAYQLTLATILAIAAADTLAQPKGRPEWQERDEQKPGQFQPPRPAQPPKQQPPKVEPPKQQQPKPAQPPKVEPPRQQPPKTAQPPKVEPPKQQQPKPAQPPKVEPPKPQPTKPQPPKVEPPKPQPPKPQPPKVEPPKPQPPKPQPPKVEPPKPQPPRHGHHNTPLEKPRERSFYNNWHRVQRNQFYGFATADETMQIHLRGRDDFEFKLEEQRHDDYRWFARYDSTLIKVDVDHKKGKGFFFSRTPDYAEIEIEGKFPCDTIVELVYAKKYAWERGEAPLKVIRIFVHVD